ncbi:unnamed protein product [Prorocentrum cordatum]|uniref:Gcp-like domain-containing protein n=1 Tax=Prorocentrum cordatum TaxID=2364126 RepID=A0ABN9X9W5_9DINO|nr:unnamed protein product [Polarella glacialis]
MREQELFRVCLQPGNYGNLLETIDYAGVRGPVSYTDGSGYDSGVPEVRRCGQAVVQLDPYSWLPVRVQAIGRAEWYAIREGFDAFPDHQSFVTDLLALAQEGERWCPELEQGRAKHARAWRDIFVASRRRTLPDPPKSRWTPAHRFLEELMGTEPQELRDWLGIGWADYFARCGAASHALAGSVVEAVTAALKQHRKVLEFISWAALQVVARKQWGCDVEVPRPPCEQARPIVVARSTDHVLAYCASLGRYQCTQCGVTATTGSSLESLQTGSHRVCRPSRVARAPNAEYFRAFGEVWVLCGDQRAGMALGAALAFEGSSQPSAPAALLPPALAEEVGDAFAALGHDVFKGNSVYCRRRCGSHCAAGDVRTVRKLGWRCDGLSPDEATRLNQQDAIRRPRGALIDHVVIRCRSVVGWWHGVFFGGDASFVGGKLACVHGLEGDIFQLISFYIASCSYGTAPRVGGARGQSVYVDSFVGFAFIFDSPRGHDRSPRPSATSGGARPATSAEANAAKVTALGMEESEWRLNTKTWWRVPLQVDRMRACLDLSAARVHRAKKALAREETSFEHIIWEMGHAVGALSGEEGHSIMQEFGLTRELPVCMTVAVRHLCERAARAASWALELEPDVAAIVVAGGVAANQKVRAGLREVAEQAGLEMQCPPPRLCVDNGVMVAWAGVERLRLGLYEEPPSVDGVDNAVEIRPRWPLGDRDPRSQPKKQPSQKALKGGKKRPASEGGEPPPKKAGAAGNAAVAEGA